MKNLWKVIVGMMVLYLVAGLVTLFFGCSNERANPVGVATPTLSKGSTGSSSSWVDEQGNKHYHAEKLIKAHLGGDVVLGNTTTMGIGKNAIEQDTYFVLDGVLSADRKRIDYSFEPHGTVFQPGSAYLRLYFGELNLPDPSLANLYYYDPATGQWVIEHQAQWIFESRLCVVEIGHFSRYAVAYSQ